MVKGIDKLIMCRPHEMPDKYYRYDSEQDEYFKENGRRPSGYQSMNKAGKYGIHRPIDSVNKIRPLVNKWRDGKPKYSGTSNITKKLLSHWRYRDEARLFFCQLEAIETIIFASENPDIDKLIKNDKGDFNRYCTKMATGTGKTIVMGMLIAYHILNSGKNYAKDILVLTPNLTVKHRLQVLLPSNPNNIYQEFDLVPAHLLNKLSSANIRITNFHQLKPKTSKTSSVAKLGTQSPKSFTKSILGYNASNILVINDEGHHAWRPSEYNNKTKEAEEAGLWTSGLDIIHKAGKNADNSGGKILRCHDFSATPFVPTGKSSTDETLFSWIISDFSLWDAIESGLVKTPRTPSQGDKFYHLYQQDGVSAELKKGSMPKLVKDAYQLLGSDWQETNKAWSNRSTPPVMITVCNTTKHAKTIVDQFCRNKLLLNTDLVKEDSLLHIDSEAIKAITTEEGKKAIRDKVFTVGKPGKLGEKICNIVSVDMLTEGWDARTVTHIMGLRAFGSQLLCEQVVGRGLRRTSYDLNESGLYESEPVSILGVPFGGLPTEYKPESSGGGGNDIHPVDICPDKPKHIISWPIVSDIRDTITVNLDINWNAVTPRQFDRTPHPTVKVGPVIDGWVATKPSKTIQSHTRQLTITYGILQDVMGNLRRLDKLSWGEYSPYNENPQQTTIKILSIIKSYLKKYVKTRLDEKGLQDMLSAWRDVIARDIFANLTKRDSESIPKATIEGTASTDIAQRQTTKKRKFKSKKTHLNIMTGDSDLEISIGKELDKDKRVISWAKSDMAGFSIPYIHPDNSERNYKPDFIVHLSTGISLVLEGKGKEDDVDRAKKYALERWVLAINNEERYGVWDSATIYGGQDVHIRLDDIIRYTEKKKYTHYCHVCGIKTKTLADSIKQFELKKTQGLLQISTYCKKCKLK